jgi:hypothetical protein
MAVLDNEDHPNIGLRPLHALAFAASVEVAIPAFDAIIANRLTVSSF